MNRNDSKYCLAWGLALTLFLAYWHLTSLYLDIRWALFADLAYCLALLLPLAACYFAYKVARKWLRFTLLAPTALFSFFTTCLLIFVFWSISERALERKNWQVQRQNNYYELLESKILGDSKINVFRTNYGATTDFGIVVEHERDFGPIRLSRRIASAYPCSEGAITRIHGNEVSISACDDSHAVSLKPWVHF